MGTRIAGTTAVVPSLVGSAVAQDSDSTPSRSGAVGCVSVATESRRGNRRPARAQWSFADRFWTTGDRPAGRERKMQTRISQRAPRSGATGFHLFVGGRSGGLAV